MEKLLEAETFKRLFLETIDSLITIEKLAITEEYTSIEINRLIEILQLRQIELNYFLEKRILTLKQKL